ncbi:MAG: LysR family transcriptional regulator [Pseudomonadales bacterium]
MQNLDWNDLRYCLAIVDEGSVTAAAKKLGVNHTTVSRRITALETQLGAPLFDRSNSGWLITPLGESILPEASQMRESAQAISRMVTADRKELSGLIRVTTIDTFMQGAIGPGLMEFTQQYPDIDIELILGDEVLDLASHDADIAFRGTDSPPPNVVGTRLGHFATGVYCTPAVYEQYQNDPGSVSAISWRGDGKTLPDWMPQYFPGMHLRYRVSSLNVLYDLTRHGYGIAQLPCGLGDASHRLIRVPDTQIGKGPGLWVLSHIDLRTTARIRIFRDFMIEAIEKRMPLLEGKREGYWKSQPRQIEDDFTAAIDIP